ncbi:hypothetical protein EDC94DRAFT_651389 [Helicostylum pulchrum]|nr:hypothetical protein EDC94DRAFT_651389 [Helicostylum pulchrum]
MSSERINTSNQANKKIITTVKSSVTGIEWKPEYVPVLKKLVSDVHALVTQLGCSATFNLEEYTVQGFSKEVFLSLVEKRNNNSKVQGLLFEAFVFYTKTIEQRISIAKPGKHLIAYYKLVETCESYGFKFFQCFPLRSTFIPSYITIDTMILSNQALKDSQRSKFDKLYMGKSRQYSLSTVNVDTYVKYLKVRAQVSPILEEYYYNEDVEAK